LPGDYDFKGCLLAQTSNSLDGGGLNEWQAVKVIPDIRRQARCSVATLPGGIWAPKTHS
jgi:hypothetical protein